MTKEQFKSIINNIDAEYQSKKFEIFATFGEKDIQLQVGTMRPCTYTGEVSLGKGGIALLPFTATEDQIVKKVFSLCLAYTEHETREGFQYKSKRVFGPHISLQGLLEAADKTTDK